MNDFPAFVENKISWDLNKLNLNEKLYFAIIQVKIMQVINSNSHVSLQLITSCYRQAPLTTTPRITTFQLNHQRSHQLRSGQRGATLETSTLTLTIW